MQSTTLTSEQRQAGIALLAIRIAAALAFLYHGSGILFASFGGPGTGGFARAMHQPVAVACLVGLAEFCGGLALLTGVLARLGAVCIIAVMLGAIFMVHLPHGFDNTKQGFEYALTQLLIAVAILVAGAGPYSLAYALRLARSRTTEGVRSQQSPPVVHS